MSKWKVRRVWSTHTKKYYWEVLCPEGVEHGWYRTWENAMEAADSYARETTVTLPRLNSHGYQKIGGVGLYSLYVGHQRDLTNVYLAGWGGATVEDEYLEPLALYLLALARHKEGTDA